MAPGIEAPAPRPFSWWWIGIALPASVAVGFTVAVILWGGTRAEHRDAFDTGWKSAAAVLAVLAAIVAVERHRLGQREHYRLLAADQAKEIDELSAKASEQLGSDKAAVRIGSLTFPHPPLTPAKPPTKTHPRTQGAPARTRRPPHRPADPQKASVTPRHGHLLAGHQPRPQRCQSGRVRPGGLPGR